MYLPSWHLEHGETWGEYLQRHEGALVAHDAASTIKTTIDAQTMRIVGTAEDLQKAGFRVVQQVASGLHEISWAIANTNASVRDLTAAVEAGFEGLSAALREVADLLGTISDAVTSPAMTAAREQYKIALELFELGRYAESLKHIERGLEHYPLGFRSQFLLGTLRLGSPRNASPKIVDTRKAEEAFLLSAQRAEQKGKKKFAAVAMLNASFAAYTQRNLGAAIEHAHRATELDPAFLDAHFRLGQLLMVDGSSKTALGWLKHAVIRDARYALLARSDRDYQRDPTAVSDTLQAIRDDKEQTILTRVREVLDVGVSLLTHFPKLADEPTFQWSREFWKDRGHHTLLQLQEIERGSRVSELRALCESLTKLLVFIREVCAVLEGFERTSVHWAELREHPRVLEWCAILGGENDWDLERALKYSKGEFAAAKEDVRGREEWLKRWDAAHARLRRARNEIEPFLALASDYPPFVAWRERVRKPYSWTRIPPNPIGDMEDEAKGLEEALKEFEPIRTSLQSACRVARLKLSSEQSGLRSVRRDIARRIQREKRRCRFIVYGGVALLVLVVSLTAFVFDIFIGEIVSTGLIGRWWEPASGAWSLAAFGACLCAWIAYLLWQKDVSRRYRLIGIPLEETIVFAGFGGFFAGAAVGWLADIHLPPFRYKAALLGALAVVATLAHFISRAREEIAKIRVELKKAEESVSRTLPENVAQHERWLRELSVPTRMTSDK